MSAPDVKFSTLTKPLHSDASLVDLFALIESNPCLWKNDSRNFKNHDLKRRLWRRFACYLQQRYPMMGPFTPDNLRYVYSIKRRQYYDELKEKTVRRKSGLLEYTGRWKFFDSLSFLRVHSEPYRPHVQSPLLYFEDEEMDALDADISPLGHDGGLRIDTDAEDPPDDINEGSEGPVDCTLPSCQRKFETPICESSPMVPDQSPDVPEPKRRREDANSSWEAPKVEAVRSLCPAQQLYDECDQFGNIIANYMRRLSEEDKLEFHCHIMNSIKDFFKCLSRYR